MPELMYSALVKCIRNILAGESSEMGEVVICLFDVSPTFNFGYGAGLRAGIESIWLPTRKIEKKLLAAGRSNPEIRPLLVFGLAPTYEKAASRMQLDDRQMLEIFRWPGAAYLQYGFTRELLITTANKVIKGASEPLSLGVQFGPDGILRISSELRHWLDNRRTNVTGMRENFIKTLGGERLSPFHLEPQPAVAEEHRRMVERLWAYEWLAAQLASDYGGIVPLRLAMDEFEKKWDILEGARLAYRTSIRLNGELNSALIESVVTGIDSVLYSIETAIDATHTLDSAVKRKL